MKKNVLVLILSFILCLSATHAAYGLEIKGVTLPDTQSVKDHTLTLVGAGVRTKTFLRIKVYVAGLYMENPSKDVREIIESDQAKRMVMHFVYKEVPSAKLVSGWNEGFTKNSRATMPELQERIDTFNGFFDTSVAAGEEVIVTYVPGQGTQVLIKGAEKGSIPGKDFMEALFKIWFGEYPADSGLKASILK